MEEFPAIPASISYRQLQAFAQSAPADPARDVDRDAPRHPALEAALEAWSRSSQELLQALQQAGPAVAGDRSPRQLMALGALQAHVAMGLKALASSRRSQG